MNLIVRQVEKSTMFLGKHYVGHLQTFMMLIKRFPPHIADTMTKLMKQTNQCSLVQDLL